MNPRLDPEVYVWACVQESTHADDAVATVREGEGLTLVIEQSRATALGLVHRFASARITLQVHSALEAIGLTAAFTHALTDAGIAANVVAGFHHNHVFVPISQAHDALETLRDLAAPTVGKSTTVR